MKNTIVSVPYIYPLCPLNFNHAKMFVVADVIARYRHSQGENVIFTVASHYSGNTAQAASEALERFFSPVKQEEDSTIFKLHRDVYHTPVRVIQTFTDSHQLLNYYTQEICWELKSLNLSNDFSHSYATNHPDFSIFVNALINAYEEKGLLVENDAGDLAINYNDREWRQQVKTLIQQTAFNQKFHQQNVLAAVKNIRNDWGFLRTNGFGVKYKNNWVIDPMFDSELFVLFDLYMRFKNEAKNNSTNSKNFFSKLFSALESGQKTDNELINIILENLPCDVFVGEEHLKNWLVKKFFAESKLLHPRFRTRKYVIMGMGFVNGQKMSASKGRGVLVKDLIRDLGPVVARLTLLLSGGNIAKACNYDDQLPQTAQDFINRFTDHLIQVLAVSQQQKQPALTAQQKQITTIATRLDHLIEEGNFRQAITELIVTIPNQHKNWQDQSLALLNLYQKYLKILLPGLFGRFPMQ